MSSVQQSLQLTTTKHVIEKFTVLPEKFSACPEKTALPDS